MKRRVAWTSILVCALLLVGCSQQNNADIEYSQIEEIQKDIEQTVIDVWDGTIADGYQDGYGTVEEPYIIATGAQLAYFCNQVNDGQIYDGQYFALGADLCLNDPAAMEQCTIVNNCEVENYEALQRWMPIGLITHPFNGNFDGRGHTISNFFIDEYFDEEFFSECSAFMSENIGIGLFGNVGKTAVIQNLNVEKGIVRVIGDGEDGKFFQFNIGALAGITLSDDDTSIFISNCQVSDCSIISRFTNIDSNIGGMIGRVRKWGGNNDSTDYISYCAVYNTNLFLNGSEGDIGGLIGNAVDLDITECCIDSVGFIEIGSRIGGLCGHIHKSYLAGCFVISPSYSYVDSSYTRGTGSLIGNASKSSIVNCFFAADGWELPKGVASSQDSRVENVNLVPYDYILDPEWIGQYLDEGFWILGDGGAPVLSFE